jgi:hypothetical protein
MLILGVAAPSGRCASCAASQTGNMELSCQDELPPTPPALLALNWHAPPGLRLIGPKPNVEHA